MPPSDPNVTQILLFLQFVSRGHLNMSA